MRMPSVYGQCNYEVVFKCAARVQELGQAALNYYVVILVNPYLARRLRHQDNEYTQTAA